MKGKTKPQIKQTNKQKTPQQLTEINMLFTNQDFQSSTSIFIEKEEKLSQKFHFKPDMSTCFWNLPGLRPAPKAQ